jgi:hypothetical protein
MQKMKLDLGQLAIQKFLVMLASWKLPVLHLFSAKIRVQTIELVCGKNKGEKGQNG